MSDACTFRGICNEVHVFPEETEALLPLASGAGAF